MKAQVVLTASESKKLISKAVLRMDIVQRALREGIFAIHPSSSTYFIVEELVGFSPPTKLWVSGVTVGRMCISRARWEAVQTRKKEDPERPEGARTTWVFQRGELTTTMDLPELIDKMKEGDVYVKGVNCIDSEGVVGVLIGSNAGAGTIGKIVAISKTKGFKIVSPAGLEKFIPGSVREAALDTGLGKELDWAMGIPAGLFVVEDALPITEVDAIRILTGATAIPIAAGGLGGTEGSLSLLIKGDVEQVLTAVRIVESVKGAEIPDPGHPECIDCEMPKCQLREDPTQAYGFLRTSPYASIASS